MCSVIKTVAHDLFFRFLRKLSNKFVVNALKTATVFSPPDPSFALLHLAREFDSHTRMFVPTHETSMPSLLARLVSRPLS